MTERPILFSTPMVQAILAGRKTQTRRIVKPHREVIAQACKELKQLTTVKRLLDEGGEERLQEVVDSLKRKKE